MFNQNKKAFLQISFAWLFAIIVGAFILFLAIFAVVKTISTEETISDVKTAKEMGILLNPLETGFVVGQTSSLTFPVETRIHNNCDNQTGVFGKQMIGISQKSFNKWTETDINVGFVNKYIFSNKIAEGTTFFLFSKPFNFPFKATDVIYLISANNDYCFVDAPEEIEEEILALKQNNLFIGNCSDKMIKICFSSSNCEIYVDTILETVEKNNERLYYRGGGSVLMYAAIFSDIDIYDCQLQRLMKRVSQLSQIYIDKENFISERGCNSNLGGELTTLNNAILNIKTSSQLTTAANIASIIENKNDLNSQCKLW